MGQHYTRSHRFLVDRWSATAGSGYPHDLETAGPHCTRSKRFHCGAIGPSEHYFRRVPAPHDVARQRSLAGRSATGTRQRRPDRVVGVARSLAGTARPSAASVLCGTISPWRKAYGAFRLGAAHLATTSNYSTASSIHLRCAQDAIPGFATWKISCSTTTITFADPFTAAVLPAGHRPFEPCGHAAAAWSRARLGRVSPEGPRGRAPSRHCHGGRRHARHQRHRRSPSCVRGPDPRPFRQFLSSQLFRRWRTLPAYLIHPSLSVLSRAYVALVSSPTRRSRSPKCGLREPEAVPGQRDLRRT